jgi:hypothetical protein
MATVASGGAGGSGGGGGGKKPRKIPSGPKWHTKKRRRLKKSEKKKKASALDKPGDLDPDMTREQARQIINHELNVIDQMQAGPEKDGKIRGYYTLMVSQGFIQDHELKTMSPWDQSFHTSTYETSYYKEAKREEKERIEKQVNQAIERQIIGMQAENTVTMREHLRDFVRGPNPDIATFADLVVRDT